MLTNLFKTWGFTQSSQITDLSPLDELRKDQLIKASDRLKQALANLNEQSGSRLETAFLGPASEADDTLFKVEIFDNDQSNVSPFAAICLKQDSDSRPAYTVEKHGRYFASADSADEAASIVERDIVPAYLTGKAQLQMNWEM